MIKFAAGYICGVASVCLLGVYLVAQDEEKEAEREAAQKRDQEAKA